MLSIIEKIKQGQLWDFHGGIHPAENKVISTRNAIQQAGLPSELVLPLKQHIGGKGDILVTVGQSVLKGQPLTQGNIAMCVPIHAPTSGKIVAIEPRTVAHPSGLTDLCIVIETDGNDQWLDNREPITDFLNEDPIDLIERIRQSGISGMGGAGFPTSRKLQSGVGKADILIINAAECEPYITADDRLMQDYASEIVTGIKILQHILTPKLVIIAIEDNKPDAIKALNAEVSEHDNILIRVIPTKYPSGSSRQLVKILTGKEVPANGRSTDIGVIMQNVGTIFAVKRAICNAEPLIERVVTLTGNSIDNPGNYWVRLGTNVQYLMDIVGYKADKKHPRIIMGGSLMGFTLPHQQIPITKITNCIITPDRKELPLYNHEMACIRCSSCADACPSSLLPQQLYWYAKSEEFDKCEEYNLSDCIECGACAYVCPSEIPLVQYYRQAKSEIYARKQDALSADRAKVRFEEKNARMERDKLERENKFKLAAENRRKEMKAEKPDGSGNDAIAAAIARVKAQKAAEKSGVATPKPAVAAAIARAKAKQAEAAKANSDEPDNSEMMKLREERKQQARERKAKLAAETNDSEATPAGSTDKKDAVAAAIARAKARKATQAEETTETSTEPNIETQGSEEKVDPKKAAVAAAIARAKARKTAQAEETTEASTEADIEIQEPEEKVDPKKAAVAAAIARAKARKAAQAEETTEASTEANIEIQEPEEKVDLKKAAVAAAIARAKARKAAQAEETTEASTEADIETQEPEEKVDPKKAAVAAAIARAKARKAAQENNNKEE
ncbi:MULTISPECIES: electron transport complex subunit RsxC [Aliivibrio]|uniref:Ion-translocating oxidoreductase complex subunit C n=1 Tax=Aliivibrio finisterrensis TaxID=511998 RepID=A0A4Q5KT68_9GAMM|nr:MULTISPECIES: electron transport complex subunit RsxC [Aliivibrio]MDD9179483.1 electron transport complex subunit RsxC [Aliivibrio sp. A6]RYU50939.1 electron transport complex subunit RsxC [Aliivibrio finisterrensis]RYU51640.1 electron transport complex subunit RsxC [Aliivibrio finisterrensis]RYU63961.1 electron transport complex subunit RsxC [Aliivibrio finisterrensis]RYU82987.1 electron transport complex subunit RsxC [Aliivibrio finisterrensis]